MIDGRLLTEKLLSYATEHLELSAYDVPVKRGILLKMLDLTPGQPPLVKSSVDFDKLKADLREYARVKGLSTAGEEAFSEFLLAMLAPLPSKVDKKFKTMREQFSAQIACDYLYELSVCVGSVKKDWAENNPVYHRSGDMEIILSDKSQINDKTPVLRACPLCDYTQGLFHDSFVRTGPSCNVRVNLGGKDYRMHYVDGVARERDCVVASLEHGKSLIGENTVVAMLDFIEYLPEYYIETTDDVTLTGSFCLDHDYFTAGEGYGSTVAGKPNFTLKSQLYPDVDVWGYNSSVSAVKLVSYNRATLEKCACELIEGWRAYKDESLNVVGAADDGKNHNFVTLSAGYTKDNRYSLTVILTVDRQNTETKNAFSGDISISALLGRVVLKNQWAEVFEKILGVITKKIPEHENPFTENGELQIYSEFADGVIGDCAKIKDAVKAEAALKNVVFAQINSALLEKAVFGSNDKGSRLFKSFLSTLDVK